MSIRAKTLGINSFALACVLAIVYLVASPLILEGFKQVEAASLRHNVSQANDAIKVQESSLVSKLEDWSNWDDTYQLVDHATQPLLEADFGGSAQYSNPVFDMVIYVNRAGAITYNNGGLTVPDDLRSQLIPGSPFLKYGNKQNPDTEKDSVSGLLSLKGGLLMLAARPIVQTDGNGPAHGTILFAKYLDAKSKRLIAGSTHLDLGIYQLSDPAVLRQASALPADVEGIQTKIINDNSILGYAYIDDINERPIGILQVRSGRPIYQQGKHSLRLFIFVMLVAGVVFAALTALLLELLVLRRITLLTRKVAEIKDEKSLHVRLRFKGKDEVSSLANSINQMLSRIKGSTAQIGELNKALQHEKDGVERLVRQRTHQLEAEKSRFLASINSLPLGFILADTNGTVLMLNPSIKHILNIDEQDTAKVEELVATEDSVIQKLIHLSQKTVKQKKITNSELTTKEGRYLHVMIAPVLTRDGEIDGVVILIEDVTEARILDRSKDEFFSIASHELRTPLTAIRGNTSMIKEFYRDQLKDKDLDSMVTDIYSSSVRLIDIVNDFLDASSLEQGKMNFTMEDFSLEDVIEKVIYEMSSVASERKLYLRTDKSLSDLPTVYGDPNRVKQVIYNLIGNALKFTDEGGVTLTAEAMPHDKIKILVSDTGRGISPEGQQLLFRKFQQAGSSIHTRDATQGTGLGLYISKLIVERLGGLVQVEHSQAGVGTTFSFTLPVHAKGDGAKQ